MTSDRRERSLLILFTALGFFARLYFLLAFDNVFSTEVEDYSKINLVNAWIAHGKPYPDPNFGPLHTWLIYFLGLVFSDRVWAVRVFSLLCGTATIPIFYYAARRMVGQGGAIVAAALFAFYPAHVRASATSLAEAPYTLAFFAGLLAFMEHQYQKAASFGRLVLSSIAFTIAGMLRFEAWLFYPVLCLFALRRGFARAIAYACLLAIFPAIHMYVCWKTAGNPLSFGDTSAASFLLYLPQMSLSYRATAWPVNFYYCLSPALAALSVGGIFWALAAGRGAFPLALFAFPYALLSYRTIQGKIDPALLRYGIVLAALPMPLAGAAADAAFRKVLRSPHIRAVALSVFLALMAASMLIWSYTQAEENRLPDDVTAVAKYLRTNARPDERIILDKRFHPYLVVESRHDPNLFTSLVYKSGAITEQARYEALVRKLFPLAYINGQEVSWGRDLKLYDEAAFAAMMTDFNPTMLVLDYESGGNMQAFPIPPDASETRMYGRDFRRLLRVGNYAVFSIRPEESAP